MASFQMPLPALTKGTSPATPSRKRRAARNGDDMDGEDTNPPTPSKKAKVTTARPRKTAKPLAGNRAIPRCYEECTKEDKMMIDMRKANKTWAEIQQAWQEETGQTVAVSTLPNRYTRLQANFVKVSLADQAKLLEAKRDVEAKFAKKKWSLIAKAVEDAGGAKYKDEDLRREWSKLVAAKAPAGPPSGVEYPDFDKSVLDDGAMEEE